MSDAPHVPEVLTKEVGAGKFKFPVIVWAGIGIVGVLIARKASSLSIFGGGASSSTPESDTVTDPTIPLGGYGGNGAVPIVNGAAGGSFDSGTASSITDNEQWRTAATNYLVSANYDALAAATAIADYLNGNALTSAERIMVEAALRRIGPTPEPVFPQLPVITPTPIVVKPPTKPKPTPVPPKTKPPVPTAKPIQQTHALYTAKLKAAHASNERFVAFVNLQNGHGTWWLTNLGGIYTAGSAPYLGSPIANGSKRTDWAHLSPLFPKPGYRATAGNGAAHMDFTQ